MTSSLLWGLAILAGGAGAWIGALLVRAVAPLLERGGLVAANFQGKRIATGVGIVLPLAASAPAAALALAGVRAEFVGLWVTLLFGMGLLGLFDDAAGDRRHGGLYGHLQALLDGRPTTGSLKAVYGAALALYAGWVLHDGAGRVLLAALTIALATNAVNLLDLRPGRALKGYFLMTLLGLAALAFGDWNAGERAAALLPAAALLGAAAALFPGDLKARYMLGDAGSNVLGAGAGLVIASGPVVWQIAWAASLALLHAYTERRSLSDLIERVPWLRRLDRLGRE